jgi:hypothetical protein
LWIDPNRGAACPLLGSSTEEGLVYSARKQENSPMPEMRIHLRLDRETGKKVVTVDLRTDPDTLPHEHEQQHRALVDQLLERGIQGELEGGDLTVERENKEPTVAPRATTQPASQRQAHKQGSD